MGKSGGVNKGQKVVENRGYSTIAMEVVPWCPCLASSITPYRTHQGAGLQLSSAIIFVILVKVQWGLMQKVQLTDPVPTHANCVNNTYTICILFLGRLDFYILHHFTMDLSCS